MQVNKSQKILPKASISSASSSKSGILSNLPEIAINNLSPTSDRMKNSFIITNGATKNPDLLRKNTISLRRTLTNKSYSAHPEKL